jgi:hypothetical protein
MWHNRNNLSLISSFWEQQTWMKLRRLPYARISDMGIKHIANIQKRAFNVFKPDPSGTWPFLSMDFRDQMILTREILNQCIRAEELSVTFLPGHPGFELDG